MGKSKPPVEWRVTCRGGEIDIKFGARLSAIPFDDDVKLKVLGKALINLGTRLLTSTTGEDEDGYEDEEDY